MCGRPRVPLIKGGAPLPDAPKPFAYDDALLRPKEWWRPDLSVAEQFEAFLGHIGGRPPLDEVSLLLADTPLAAHVARWTDLAAEVRASFHAAWSEWCRDFDALSDEWTKRLEARDTTPNHVRLLNALGHQAEALWLTTVIEELGTRQFLPRYGFPIGVQQLTVPRSRDGVVAPIRLERAGILAVSEYVPGSSVLVGGRTYRSRGVVRSWAETGFGKRAWLYECCAGHVFYSYSEVGGDRCGIPGCDKVRKGTGALLLLPRYGFTTAAWDPPQWEGRAERTGTTTLATMAFVMGGTERRRLDGFGGIAGLVAQSCDGGEMLAINRGDADLGFAVCTRCGYADGERGLGQGRINLPTGFELHAPLDSWADRPCWPAGEAPVFRNHHMAATQVTDIVQLDFAGVQHAGLSEAVVATIGHALRLAGAELLEQDHREFGSLACPIGLGGRIGLLLFDAVAGGAGHVLELASVAGEWLTVALDVMRRGDEHDRTCVTACLECLLTTSSQIDMEAGRLQRRAARDVLIQMLSGQSQPAHLAPSASSGAPLPAANEERIRRAQDRSRKPSRRK